MINIIINEIGKHKKKILEKSYILSNFYFYKCNCNNYINPPKY